ncbi:capsular biosynthesis protein [Pusillimonas sp. CC-YST705]|uniref:Capsular biosynthesis protein n=1 Tax=Mesopusillimonas faecipullorum TaxID=2755040 RepID=A0ABS8CAI3_9BURK|nr:capsular biosynthesis protein [Mesopusillimonas faecipullorum]MCB5363036.1 capsular biosynthesis protein [Mesopusillimonas faecipullorum]
MSQQRFLFLQGVCSPFFRQLGLALRNVGQVVRKVNFNVGDSVYWRLGQAATFRGPMDTLPEFYAKQYEQHGISDIVLFGDCRPVHSPGIELAKQLGIRVHVFEEGYFRPFWITLERDGVNGNSTLPKDPDWYRQQALQVTHFASVQSFESPFWKRAAYDIGYNFWFGANALLHSRVKSHVPYHPVREYINYVGRGVRTLWYSTESQRTQAQVIEEARKHPFYLLPLQLASDAQIVHHSPFSSMLAAMLHVLESFARSAPKHSRLVVKIHPLDPGMVNYRRQLRISARQLDIEGRVFFLESGNTPALLNVTKGVVTVNSTVGGSALVHNCPTITLGEAIYSIPGLTFQGELEQFWHTEAKPDVKLFRKFRDVVISQTQINGGFYTDVAIQHAIINSIDKLLEK